MGVATQCLKSSKCFRAKPQYYANVCLKYTSPSCISFLAHFYLRINVKLGGINTIPDPSSVSVLTDQHNPTIVMGASFLRLCSPVLTFSQAVCIYSSTWIFALTRKHESLQPMFVYPFHPSPSP
jgi:hypothetical protein